MNIGEEIVADYLRYIKGCEFVQRNLYTEDVQGEIDVVGIDLHNKKVYFCEVAVHLETGLHYVKDKKPNNVNKLTDKFSKNIEYAKKYFADYEHSFMLWSPIVKNSSKKAKHNQLNDVQTVIHKILRSHEITIEAVINNDFLCRLNELRKFSLNETKDIKSSVIRLYQIEEKIKAYLDKNKTITSP